jgi:hypothetical protein
MFPAHRSAFGNFRLEPEHWWRWCYPPARPSPLERKVAACAPPVGFGLRVVRSVHRPHSLGLGYQRLAARVDRHYLELQFSKR